MNTHNYLKPIWVGRVWAIFPTILVFFLLFFSLKTNAQVDINASVGTSSGSYSTLKEAFDKINDGTHQGAITIAITANTTETATAVLNASGSGSASYISVSISPSGGAARTISGSIAGPIIDLNGADDVTIDGINTGGNGLTISNTSTAASASTIQFIGGATNNTITNCEILGSSVGSTTASSDRGVLFFSTGGNNNNTISNNNITNAGTRPRNAIYSYGTSGNVNIENTISSCNFYSIMHPTSPSFGVNLNSFTSKWTISSNSFYEAATVTTTSTGEFRAINIVNTSGNEFTISNNFIGGSQPSCGGTAWTKNGNNNVFYGIYLAAGTTTASNIQGNTISNFSWTNSSNAAWHGIWVNSGLVNVGTTTGNTIGALSSNGNITFTGGTTGANFYGIYISAANADCQNNTISSVTAAASNTSNATNFWGIFKIGAQNTIISNNTIGSATVANSIEASSISSSNAQSVVGINNQGTGSIIITENIISNLSNASTNSSTSSTSGYINGIRVISGTNTIMKNIVCNLSVFNANTTSTNGASAIGINFTSTTAATQTISENTIFNIQNTRTGFTGIVMGLYCSGPSFTGVVDRNLIHSLITNSNSSKLWGVYVVNGRMLFSNNVIRLGLDVNGNSLTNSIEIAGFHLNSSTTGNQSSLKHNTIYIGGDNVVTTTTFHTYGIWKLNTATDTIVNNVIVNQRQSTTAVLRHYPVYYQTVPGYSDNNVYWFQSGHGQVDRGFATLQLFRAFQQAKFSDMQSVIANPGLIAPNAAASSMDLSIDPTFNATPVEGAGQLSQVSLDFNGLTRSVNSPVDIGAFSGNYIGYTSANDLYSPYIQFDPIGAIAPQNTFQLNDFAIISDQISGVNTNSGTRPRLYYKLSTHTNTFGANDNLTDGWKWVEADNTSSPFQFTLDFTLLFGGVPSTGTVQYFLAAQDEANTPNVITWPIGGSNLTNVSSITTAPTAPSTFVILAPPTATAATLLTNQSFTANWNAVTGASGYFLDVSTHNDFSSFVTGFNDLDVGNVAGYSVTGLTLNTVYFYRLRAYNSTGNSIYSNTIQINTVDNAPTVQATNINVVNNACGGASFEFTRGNGSQVAVFIRAVSSGNPTAPNGTSLNHTVSFTGQFLYGNTSSTYSSWRCIYVGTGNRATVTDLTLNTTYRVAVVEFNGAAGFESYLNDYTGTNITNFTATTGSALTGTKSIKASGGDYVTLTEAMIHLNNCGIGTGGVTFELGDNTYPSEYFPIIVLQPSGTGVNNPIKIEPAANTTPVITGNAPLGVLTLYGTDYITIDGKNANGSSLTLENTNTSTTAHTVWITNIANYVTLTNLTALGAVSHDGGAYSRDAVIPLSATTNDQTRNSNITITNSKIGQASGPNKPSSLIKSTYYTSGTDQVLIDNCEFFNWFSDNNNNVFTHVNAAIQLGYSNGGSNNTNWSITNNSFYFTEEQIFTQARVYGISIWGSGSNFHITHNYFGGTEKLCGGNKMKVSGSPFLMGFMYVHGHATWTNINTSTAITNTFSNNIMSNIDFSSSNLTNPSDYFDGSRFFFAGIHAGRWFVENNRFGSMSVNSDILIANTSYSRYRIFDFYSSDAAVTIPKFNNNSIGGVTINSDYAELDLLFAGRSSSGSTNIDSLAFNTMGSNLANSISFSGSTNNNSRINGFRFVTTTGNNRLFNNSVSNLTLNHGTIEALVSSVSVNCNENIIANLSTSQGDCSGIRITGGTNIVRRNFIRNLIGTGTITGIHATNSSGTQTIDNNIISIGQGVSDALIYGIHSYYGQNIYFNTVVINGESSSGSNNSHAFFRNSSWTATSNVRNNIFSNFRTNNGGTGKHYAAYLGATTSLTLRENNYFVNGTGGVLGYSPSADRTSLPLYTGSDVNSLTLNPSFDDNIGASVQDYQPKTVLDGVTISGYSTDFIFDPRPTTLPTMGALESRNLWEGTLSTAFATTSNWSLNAIPGNGSKVKFSPTAANHLVLDQNRSIGNIDFNGSGKNIILGNFDLTVSSISGADASNFIQTNGSGVLKTTIPNNASFVFPVGNVAYNPVTLTNKNSASDLFSVKVRDEVLGRGVSGTQVTTPHVNVTWDISKTNANSSPGIDLVFQWESSQEQNSISSFRLNHFKSSTPAWEFASGNSGSVSGVTTKTMLHTGYIGTFSPFAIGESSTLLPAMLVDFSAKAESQTAVLQWTTSLEMNNSHFDVQKSEDGHIWKTIGRVEGSGTSYEKREYGFIDDNPYDLTFYRLLQVDKDGKQNYSGVRLVQMYKELIKKQLVSIYPNPSNGALFIEPILLEPLFISIYDINGKLLYKESVSQVFHIQNLASGVYIIEVNSGNLVERVRFLVQR